MSASNDFETNILELVFKNAAYAGIGDAGGLLASAADGNLYVSLHTGDPGEAGPQTSNECAYTSYARVAVPRDGVEWTVAAEVASNTNAVTFPQCTGGSETATHFGIGVSAIGGSEVLLFSGALTAPVNISNLITPEIAAGDLTVTVS